MYEIGNKVIMKKPHACGTNLWTITRIGADFKIKCDHCDHLVMLPRVKFEKSVKKIVETTEK